jgi:non-heme chloroperoxidase
VAFSRGWPLDSDSWEGHVFPASHGYRCQPWDRNEMNTCADDVAALIECLNLKNAILIGFSTGGGEVARRIGRHATKRVAKAALASSVPPLSVPRGSTVRAPKRRKDWSIGAPGTRIRAGRRSAKHLG